MYVLVKFSMILHDMCQIPLNSQNAKIGIITKPSVSYSTLK